MKGLMASTQHNEAVTLIIIKMGGAGVYISLFGYQKMTPTLSFPPFPPPFLWCSPSLHPGWVSVCPSCCLSIHPSPFPHAVLCTHWPLLSAWARQMLLKGNNATYCLSPLTGIKI